MKKVRMIYSPVQGGYWSKYYTSFRGILFATEYSLDDDSEIMKDLELAVHGSDCEIKTIWRK